MLADELLLNLLKKGIGTDERALIRIMVLRSERDMQDIKREFQAKYKNTLESFLKVKFCQNN